MSTSSNVLTGAVVLLSIAAIALVSADDAVVACDSLSPGQVRELSIGNLLSSKEDGKYTSFLEPLLSTKDGQVLADLRSHSNWGISLQAAWMAWVDDRQRLSGPRNISRSREGAVRWLGLAEGRLGLAPPHAWSQCIKDIYTPENALPKSNKEAGGQFYFETNQSSKTGRRELVRGLFGAENLRAKREGEMLRISIADSNEELIIELDKLEIRPLNDDGHFGDAVIEWHPETNPRLLVLRRMYLDPFTIVAIPKGSSAASWIATAGHYHRIGSACLPRMDHFVHVECRGSSIYLLGCSNCCGSRSHLQNWSW